MGEKLGIAPDDDARRDLGFQALEERGQGPASSHTGIGV